MKKGIKTKNQIAGVDVGGTFTDLISTNPNDNGLSFVKVPTTVKNQALGVMDSLRKSSLKLEEIDLIIHGTTTTTNALLERKLSKTGLITTKGFRDVLELGRRTRPQPYGMKGSFEPIIPRNLRFEVSERTDAQGKILIPLMEDEILKVIKKLLKLNCESVIIHFLHSYANPKNELIAKKILLKNWPNHYVTSGHELLSENREYERGVTASINASVQPILENYISKLETELKKNGYKKDLLVMNGNGGTVSSKLVSKEAAKTVMSGPASGVIAAAYTGKSSKIKNMITYDMGGTSTDVALIINNEPAVSNEIDIEYGIPVHVPMVDVRTIGAGGGSIARVNQGGLLEVGPDSAGSVPGPICYGNGGEHPTISDANYLLGRFQTEQINVKKNDNIRTKINKIFKEKLSNKLNESVLNSAEAIIKIANNKMANAIRMVSISLGEDPRKFNLFAFGGAGPMHACALAKELDIPKVFIPARPGLTNALGCMVSDLRQDFSKTINISMENLEIKKIHNLLKKFNDAGLKLIKKQKIKTIKIKSFFSLDMQFLGQTHIIRIPLPNKLPSKQFIQKSFEEYYFKRFKVKLDKISANIVNLNVSVVGEREIFDLKKLINLKKVKVNDLTFQYRKVYFGGKWFDTKVFWRDDLPEKYKISGPAIVEQMDSTIVINPNDKAVVDNFGNLIIDIG